MGEGLCLMGTTSLGIRAVEVGTKSVHWTAACDPDNVVQKKLVAIRS